MGDRQQLRADLKQWVPPKYSEELGRALVRLWAEGVLPKKHARPTGEATYLALYKSWRNAKTIWARYQIRALFNRALTLAVSMRMQS